MCPSIINEDGVETRSGRSGFVVDIVVLLQVSFSIVYVLLSVSPYRRRVFIHDRHHAVTEILKSENERKIILRFFCRIRQN